MGSKMCPKIILEGTRLTFKTEIALELNAHPRVVGPRKYRYHSPIISAEWCAFTNFPWGRGLINFKPQDELIDASQLPTLRIDVSDNDISRATETIADYLHKTGAIWANY